MLHTINTNYTLQLLSSNITETSSPPSDEVGVVVIVRFHIYLDLLFPLLTSNIIHTIETCSFRPTLRSSSLPTCQGGFNVV